MRVLVVDDQPDVLRTLAHLVASGGYQVDTRLRFDEARHYIDVTPPDLLVVDVRLGAYNGLQLALHMRNARPDAPIVVLSAYDDPMIRKETERIGARWLSKPISRKALLDCLAGGAEGTNPPPAP
jgi:DNA-binding response OmpR family regulator